MSTPLFTKHPNEAVNIGIDFSDRLPSGATISSSSATLLSGDVTIGSSAISGSVVYCRCSGGTAGTQSSINFTATLSTTEVLVGILNVTPMNLDF